MQKRKCLLSTVMMAIMVCAFVGCGNSDVTKKEDANQHSVCAEAVETVSEVDSNSVLAVNAQVDTNSEESLNNGLTKEEYYEKYGTVEGFITPAGTYREVELEKPVMLGYLKEPLEGAKEYVAKREDGKVGVSKDFDVYSLDKEKVGHYDEDCLVTIKSYNEEWCVIKCLRFEFLAKTEEVNEALTNAEVKLIEEEPTGSVVEEVLVEENNIKEEPIAPTYVVTDMTKTMYAIQSVNLRSGPSTEYDRIGGLTTNQEVAVTGQSETGWYRISYNGGDAFVSNSYLSDTKVEIIVENTNETTTDKTDTSEITEPEVVPSEPTPEVAPETPVITEEPVVEEPKTESKPSPDEVLAFIHETLQGAGIQYYPDVYPDSKWGPSGGMGWSEGSDDPNWLMENPDQILAPYQVFGYTLYYIEYLGEDENGEYIIRWYWG